MPASQTIAYDRPVADYISGLDATFHVTHQSFTKTGVTLHHNAGVNFSHDTILNIWKTRPASAHFNVDAKGTVAQYVRVNEYAWATGSGEGNRSTISIEMANSTGGPSWQVSETTWKATARLVGWLFAKVIKARPSKSNLYRHHDWYQTACAGPFIDQIYSQVLAEAQRNYDIFTGATPQAPTPEPTQAGDLDPMITLNDIKQAIKDGVIDVIDKVSLVSVGDVKWTITHVLDWQRRALDGQGKQIAGLQAVVKELGAKANIDVKAVYDAAYSGAKDSVDAEIAGAQTILQVSPAPAA